MAKEKKDKPVKKETQSSADSKEIVIDLAEYSTPIAILVGAVIIALPVSLSIFFGLSNIGGGAFISAGGTVQAAECDESNPYSDGCLIEHAQEIGLNVSQFEVCMDERPFDSQVDEDYAYGQEIGVQGTPSLFIGENTGNSMEGFNVGASVSIANVRQLVNLIESEGIQAAAAFWGESQSSDLGAYETQLRDFYTQQGQSGDQLEKSIETGLEQRRQEIASSVEVRTIDFGDGAQRGNADASAVMMEFSDYECPFCEQFATGVGTQIKNELVDNGELLFIYREFPLENIHPSARKLSNAALCAGDQDSYFEMHDRIFGITN